MLMETLLLAQKHQVMPNKQRSTGTPGIVNIAREYVARPANVTPRTVTVYGTSYGQRQNTVNTIPVLKNVISHERVNATEQGGWRRRRQRAILRHSNKGQHSENKVSQVVTERYASRRRLRNRKQNGHRRHYRRRYHRLLVGTTAVSHDRN